MTVTELLSYEDCERVINENTKCIVMYGSANCGHCIHFLPIFTENSRKYKNVKFCHVEATKTEIDNILGYPTIVFYKNGEPYDSIVGADVENFLLQLQKLSNMA